MNREEEEEYIFTQRMPLIIKDYVWRQTEKTVIIEVPSNGMPSNKVDLFTSPKYIKASYPPFFFDVLLSNPICTKESKCVLSKSKIIFELQKCETKNWDRLESDLPKNERQALKNDLIAAEYLRIQRENEERSERRGALQKLAVKEAIRLDTKQRQQIETIKTNEKNKALNDFVAWHNVNLKRNMSRTKLKTRQTTRIAKEIKPPERRDVPNIRTTASLEVSFTPRELPTPSRESRLEEENEWFRKQTEARRSVGFVSEDLRPEEKNPMYLKTKGDEFMKQGNYLGAISAYSFGIKLSNKYVDLFIGRSEAQYQQGKYN